MNPNEITQNPSNENGQNPKEVGVPMGIWDQDKITIPVAVWRNMVHVLDGLAHHSDKHSTRIRTINESCGYFEFYANAAYDTLSFIGDFEIYPKTRVEDQLLNGVLPGEVQQ